MSVIVISGKPGSGSTTTGKLLAKKLGLDFFSSGLWFKQQFNSNLNQKNETDSSIKGLKSNEGQSKELHNKLDSLQKTIATKGDIVIDSKLGIHMLKNTADFNVWIEAPLSIRAQRYSNRSNDDINESITKLEEKENMERSNWMKIYGFDYFSQRNEADLIIDVSEKTPEEVVNYIIRMGQSMGKI